MDMQLAILKHAIALRAACIDPPAGAVHIVRRGTVVKPPTTVGSEPCQLRRFCSHDGRAVTQRDTVLIEYLCSFEWALETCDAKGIT
eukprot:3537390-Alexandrium_andersonii.AAC.1